MNRTTTRRISLALPALTLLGLLVVVPGTAMAAGYTFKAVAVIGAPAPGGGKFTNDFEPSRLNNRGELAFTTDLTDHQQEGVFLATGGQILPIMRYGQPAPGGGTFGAAEFGYLGLNDAGDMALPFSLEPATTPLGVNVGLYRWSHATQTLTPVLVPGVTPAPGGGTFAGAGGSVVLNNPGAIAFTALTATDKGIHIPGENYVGFGVGAYVVDPQGKITAVAIPGDPVPGGGTFDFVQSGGWGSVMNDGGDVAFAGHRAGDPIGATPVPQAIQIQAASNVYVKHAATGQIETIAKVGDPLPGGGALIFGFAAGLNTMGDLLFGNVLNPALLGGPAPAALYLSSGGQTVRVAGPGDAMPGGGKLTLIGGASLNNRGEVVFAAALDTKEEGLYRYAQGSLSQILKSGMDLPGVGTIFSLEQGNSVAPGVPPIPVGAPATLVAENDPGQVAFVATLKDARIVLLLGTPSP
jgi:hypothetical protein